MRAAQREVMRARLRSQGVELSSAGTTSAAITPVVERLLAVQAQDYGQGVWALGVRAPGSTKRDVERALETGAVVRSWPMRGTLHFCRPEDLRALLAFTAPRTIAGMAARHRELGVDAGVLARAREIAVTELRGGGALGRDEYLALVAAAGVETGGQRGVHLIWLLAHEGLVCWGPPRGTQQAMVLLDEWAPAAREIPDGGDGRDALLGELVLRYVRGHGPVSLKDFCWWSKITVAEARRGLARVRDRLNELPGPEGFDEVLYVEAAPAVGAADADARSTAIAGPATANAAAVDPGAGGPAAGDPAAGGPAEVKPARIGAAAGGAAASGARGRDRHALPGFDEYLLGYRSRTPQVPAAHLERIVPGNNGIFLPTLVSRGEVVGTWRRSITATRVTVTLDPFAPLGAVDRRGFERALRDYARFLGLPLRLDEAGG